MFGVHGLNDFAFWVQLPEVATLKPDLIPNADFKFIICILYLKNYSLSSHRESRRTQRYYLFCVTLPLLCELLTDLLSRFFQFGFGTIILAFVLIRQSLSNLNNFFVFSGFEAEISLFQTDLFQDHKVPAFLFKIVDQFIFSQSYRTSRFNTLIGIMGIMPEKRTFLHLILLQKGFKCLHRQFLQKYFPNLSFRLLLKNNQQKKLESLFLFLPWFYLDI